MIAIKFCGLTRPEDAREAAALGARYAGVIFAGGPRQLDIARATAVLAHLPAFVGRVGVFGDQTDDEILNTAGALGLTVVQLHGGPDSLARVKRLRLRFAGEIWPVVRIAAAALPGDAVNLIAAAETFLLDALAPGALGGSGVSFDWAAIAEQIHGVRAGRRMVLAGGLKPENVAHAVRVLGPDVVDVSSGVEDAPGLKNHQRMRAFRDAAHGAIPEE